MGLVFGSVLKHAIDIVTDNPGDVLFCIKNSNQGLYTDRDNTQWARLLE